MSTYKNRSDFLIPIDIDEFIAFSHFNNDNNNLEITINKEKILNEIEILPRDGRAFKFIFSLSKPLDCETKNTKILPPNVCSSKLVYIPHQLNFTKENAQTLRYWK